MTRAPFIERLSRERAQTHVLPPAAPGVLVFLSAVIGCSGVRSLLSALDATTRHSTGYESWHPWIGALLLLGALVGVAGAVYLELSLRRDARAPRAGLLMRRKN